MSPLVLILAVARAAVGVFTWVAPMAASRAFGQEPNPKFGYIARLFGVRDLALAVGLVLSDDDDRRTWLQMGLLCDALDTAAAGIAAADGSMSREGAALAGGAAVAGSVMGAVALRQES